MPETAEWVKREIGLGGVSGGAKVHGIKPDGDLLCGAVGDDGSDPYPFPDRCNMDDPTDFDPADPNACKRCIAAYNKLPD